MFIVISLLISGIVLGAIYAIMSVGLTLIYGVTKIFNYAQGALFTLAGYIAWLLISKVGLHYLPAAILTLIAMIGVGFLFERIFVKPVRRLPNWDFVVLIVTLGCALLLDNLYLVIFGGLSKTIPKIMEGSFFIGKISIAKHDVFILIIAAIVFIALELFLKKTNIGLAMRAISQDITGAKVVGLKLDLIYGCSFALAALLAGIAALLLVPDILLYPEAGWTVLMKSMVVIVLGGLGSTRGTLYAALILGVVEVFVSFYLGAIFATPIFLLILILVLVFKPKGLAGKWA